MTLWVRRGEMYRQEPQGYCPYKLGDADRTRHCWRYGRMNAGWRRMGLIVGGRSGGEQGENQPEIEWDGVC